MFWNKKIKELEDRIKYLEKIERFRVLKKQYKRIEKLIGKDVFYDDAYGFMFDNKSYTGVLIGVNKYSDCLTAYIKSHDKNIQYFEMNKQNCFRLKKVAKETRTITL